MVWPYRLPKRVDWILRRLPAWVTRRVFKVVYIKIPSGHRGTIAARDKAKP